MNNNFQLKAVKLRRIGSCFSLSYGPPRVDGIPVISGIIRVIKRGLRWWDVPFEYGSTRRFITALCAGDRWEF